MEKLRHRQTSQCPLDPYPSDSRAHALTELHFRFYLYIIRTYKYVSFLWMESGQ